MRRLKDAVRSCFPKIHRGGLIAADQDGFWSGRVSPRRSLNKTAQIFNDISGKVIVEIGTGMHKGISGQSMRIWAQKTAAKRIVAVDLDPARIEEVRAALMPHPAIELRVEDGLDVLTGFDEPIHLLYLDFWVPDPEGSLPGTGRSEAYGAAYDAARSKMADSALILIDDTDHVHPWKHTEIVPSARRDGFQVRYEGRQTLLTRGL